MSAIMKAQRRYPESSNIHHLKDFFQHDWLRQYTNRQGQTRIYQGKGVQFSPCPEKSFLIICKQDSSESCPITNLGWNPNGQAIRSAFPMRISLKARLQPEDISIEMQEQYFACVHLPTQGKNPHAAQGFDYPVTGGS